MVIAQEDADGHRTLNDADSSSASGHRDLQLGWPQADITYRPGTRHPERAVVHLTDPAPQAPGTRRGDPHLLPARRRRRLPARRRLAARHLAGRGWTDRRVYDLSDPAAHPLAAYGVTDHAARFTLDGQVGHGIFEHGCFGRHDPSGFTGFDSVARSPDPGSGSTMATAPRPRTTTRDPEELARRLTAWLAARLPGAKAVNVTVPESNGMSSETLLFDIEHPEPPLARLRVEARRRPGRVHGLPRLRHAAAVPHDAPGRRAHRPARAARAVAGGGPGAARGAVLRHGARRGPRTAGRHALHVRGQLAARGDRRRARSASRRASIGLLARLHDQVPVQARPSSSLLARATAARCAATSKPNAPTTTGWLTGCPARPSSRAPSTGSTSCGRATRASRSSTGATRASGTSSTTVSNPPPSSTGRWRRRPRARSTSAGPSTCTASSRTSPSSFGQAGLPDFLRRDRRRAALRRTHRPHTAGHGLPHAVRRPAARDRDAAHRLPAGALRRGRPSRADPDTLILHHGSLRAMVQGSYWS